MTRRSPSRTEQAQPQKGIDSGESPPASGKLTMVSGLLAVCGLALLVRLLLLLTLVEFPGIADPNHYYNLAVRLTEGHGFSIDYLWHYGDPPARLVHPIDHWMPLTGSMAAGGMQVFGRGVRSALALFVLAGSMLPIIAFWMAQRLKLTRAGALFSAAVVAFLPELMVYSLRTDTVVPFSLLVGLTILLFQRGLGSRSNWAFAAAGFCAGLAYLCRHDAVLLMPALAGTAFFAWRQRGGDSRRPLTGLSLALGTGLLVAFPWLLRNLTVLGRLGPAEIPQMFFFTDHLDHYAYGQAFTPGSMLAKQTVGQLLGKRVFELLAAAKVMIEALGSFLVVSLAGGALLVLRDRDQMRATKLLPVAVLLLAALIAYPLLLPYKSQAGSFKKLFVASLPLLVPLAAFALERAILDRRIRQGAMVLVATLLLVVGADRVRTEAGDNQAYLDLIEPRARTAAAQPDTNGDGRIVLMVEDPFIFRYFGLQSVMYPSGSREAILEVAERYAVDYLLMPSHRPELAAIERGLEQDPRFLHWTLIPGTAACLYRIDPE